MVRDLIIIAIALFIWGIGEGSFLSFLPLYLQQLGANAIHIGAILGGFGLAGFFGHLPAGYLSDRIGRRPLLIASWVLGMIAAWLMAAAGSLVFFVVALYLYGLTAFVASPLNSYVSTAAGKWSTARVFTLISATYNFGAMFGPLIGGYIGDHYGLQRVFPFTAVIVVISTVCIFFIRPQPVEPISESSHPRGLLKNRLFIPFLGVFFFATFTMYLPQPLAPNYLQNQLAVPLTAIGRLYFVTGAGIVLLNLLLGTLEAPIGFLLGQLAMLVFSLVLWKMIAFPWLVLGFLLMGGFRAARMMGTAQLRSFIQKANLGLAFGISETVNALAIILAPLAAGYLYANQPSSIFWLSVPLIALSILFTSFFSFGYAKIAVPPLADLAVDDG